MSLEKEIIGLLKCLGAISVGFANLETLSGGPPSADIRYIMPSAKSAISFALPENMEFIQRFLAKEDILSHEKDHLTTTIYSGQISEKVKDFLESKGYNSSGVLGSGVYRREVPLEYKYVPQSFTPLPRCKVRRWLIWLVWQCGDEGSRNSDTPWQCFD